MSSYLEDTRYVNDEEWRRINDVINRSNAYVNEVQREIEQINAEIAALQRQMEAEHQARVAAQRAAVTSLQTNFNAALSATRQGMDASAAEVRANFDRNMTNLRTQASNLGQEISNLGAHFNQINQHINATNLHASRLGEQLDGLGAQIGQLNRNLQGIGDRVSQVATSFDQAFQAHLDALDSVGDKAQAILQALDDLLSRIRSLKPEVFEPEKYRALTSVRELTASSMSAGDYTAALMASQHSMIEASSLLARLVVENEQFDNALLAAKQGAAAMQGRIRSYQSTGSLVDEVSGETHDYDINFWSHNEFQRLVEEFDRLNAELAKPNLNFAQLQDITRRLATLDSKIDACDRKAREARCAAIVVQGLVSRIFERLGSTTWELVEWGYDDEDERNAYTLVYDNGAGDRVAMVVAPKNPEAPAFMMEAFSEDERRREAIKDGINAALEESGVEIIDRQVQDDCHLNTDTETFLERALSQVRTATTDAD